MKAVVAAFNQEKALVGAFSVIANLPMDIFGALVSTLHYNFLRLTVTLVLVARVSGSGEPG